MAGLGSGQHPWLLERKVSGKLYAAEKERIELKNCDNRCYGSVFSSGKVTLIGKHNV